VLVDTVGAYIAGLKTRCWNYRYW